MTTAPTSKNRSRRLRRILAVALAAPVVSLATAAPAHAETDSLSNQCIAVSGVTRACLYVPYVNWGSGQSWRSGGQLVDMNGGDGWVSTMEVKLDRQWFVSDTSWMQVLRVGNWQTHTSSISGYDPTDGAWVRLCSTSPGGTKYCLSSRYVSDNS